MQNTPNNRCRYRHWWHRQPPPPPTIIGLNRNVRAKSVTVKMNIKIETRKLNALNAFLVYMQLTRVYFFRRIWNSTQNPKCFTNVLLSCTIAHTMRKYQMNNAGFVRVRERNAANGKLFAIRATLYELKTRISNNPHTIHRSSTTSKYRNAKPTTNIFTQKIHIFAVEVQ